MIVFASGLLVLAALRCRIRELALTTPTQPQQGFDNTHLIRLVSTYAPEVGKEDYCKALYRKHNIDIALFKLGAIQESFRRTCSFQRN